MEFPKFLIVFLLLIVPFSTASNPLGKSHNILKFIFSFMLIYIFFQKLINNYYLFFKMIGATNDPGKAFCIKACTPDFTEEDCQFECKGRKFLYGSCDFQRCCCHEQPLLS